MHRWAESLTISPGFVRDNEVYAAVEGGDPFGFYALVGRGSVLELEHLWVAPEFIGRGAGRALLEHAMGRASSLGAEALRIEADPNAEGFYRRMGAERTGESAYEIEGHSRVLPLMALKLPDRRRERPTP